MSFANRPRVDESANLVIPSVEYADPRDVEREYRWRADGVLEVDFTDMYSAPVPLSYALLRAAAEHFGTEQVSEETFNEGGCETCDYGSRYGFVLTVTSPTRNIPPKP